MAAEVPYLGRYEPATVEADLSPADTAPPPAVSYTEQRAARVVRRCARDTGDAAFLLAVLGLIPCPWKARAPVPIP